jgi:hypothetical protein
MGKRFGGWNLDTPHEKWEHLKELATKRKNGPIVVTHKNVDNTDEASTQEEKS